MTAQAKQTRFDTTNITCAVERMRANAIINAQMNVEGLSMIGFNLPLFTSSKREEDGLLILAQWAIEPIRKNPAKFMRFPEVGEDALHQRAHNLFLHLSKRKDITEQFLDSAAERMSQAISMQMSLFAKTERKTA